MVISVMNNIKILYSDRIDISPGIVTNKTSRSKKWGICHNWYFLNKGFKFQPYVCNRCHDSDIAILKIKNDNYCCVISGISNSEALK